MQATSTALELTSSTFYQCHATYGGAIHGAQLRLSAVSNVFNQTYSISDGGAVCIIQGGNDVLISASTFEQTIATEGRGGGVALTTPTTVVINNSAFYKTSADQEGGACQRNC